MFRGADAEVACKSQCVLDRLARAHLVDAGAIHGAGDRELTHGRGEVHNVFRHQPDIGVQRAAKKKVVEVDRVQQLAVAVQFNGPQVACCARATGMKECVDRVRQRAHGVGAGRCGKTGDVNANRAKLPQADRQIEPVKRSLHRRADVRFQTIEANA